MKFAMGIRLRWIGKTFYTQNDYRRPKQEGGDGKAKVQDEEGDDG